MISSEKIESRDIQESNPFSKQDLDNNYSFDMVDSTINNIFQILQESWPENDDDVTIEILEELHKLLISMLATNQKDRPLIESVIVNPIFLNMCFVPSINYSKPFSSKNKQTSNDNENIDTYNENSRRRRRRSRRKSIRHRRGISEPNPEIKQSPDIRKYNSEQNKVTKQSKATVSNRWNDIFNELETSKQI